MALTACADAYAGYSKMKTVAQFKLLKPIELLGLTCADDKVGCIFGLLLVKDNIRICTFRGTGSLPEFVNESEVGWGTSIEQGMDHIWQRIDVSVPAVKMPTLYTGHSLGGALATLAAQKYASPGDLLITFGCPKILRIRESLALVGKLRGLVLHAVNEHDIVPMLPSGNEYANAGQVEVRKTDLNPINILGNHELSTYARVFG